ncbi:hypothetical protein [Shewanella pealeana]|uniref:Uncharacterized protein n=1 Tax=Shewanella pealeana (strain ATCC 700345 / ANG-SQ1) TaxID=398579 RepID=A8GZ54_SHEPA|nr:hypothetical protein [Shewanella pealeana]ABV85591.1 hypothetical protein Spea_0263 [Shewanella pealeana ATCC 700345]
MKNALLVSLLAVMLIPTSAHAEEERHTKDPRNAAGKVGVEVSHHGELKLAFGNGAKNWYGDNENELIFLYEFETGTSDSRFRLINFDDRFGGIYADIINTNNESVLNTIGYMLPFNADNGKTMFFPSINYSYLALDESNELRTDVPEELGGGNHSQLSSLNLYILHPWNETHFTFIEMFGARSFAGVEMEMYDVAWTQGMNSTLLNSPATVYFKGQYTRTEMFGEFAVNGSINDEDLVFSFGVDIKF